MSDANDLVSNEPLFLEGSLYDVYEPQNGTIDFNNLQHPGNSLHRACTDADTLLVEELL